MTAVCPRCSAPLKDVRGVHVCLTCGGAFLAAAASETVARACDESASATAVLVGTQASRRADTSAVAPCPLCRQAMQRFRVGPVDVDCCMEHGSWYDRGELQLVRQALLRGVDGVPATSSAASSSAAPSGIELARAPSPPKPPRPATTGRVMIDAGVQGKINALASEEQWQERHRHHHHHHHSHGGLFDSTPTTTAGVALDLVVDVLDILR